VPRAPFTASQHGFAFENAFVNHLINVPALGIDVTTLGRCGGMAYASLDYWNNRLGIPESSSLPADGSLVGDYIYWRLVDSLVTNGFKFFHFMRTPDHPTLINGIGVARATREEEFLRLKQFIDMSRPCPLGLTRARDIGAMGNDHQVVATGYEDGDPYSRVFIYDNNHPGAEHVLSFKTAYDPGEREVTHSDGSVWRGFFVEAYAPQVPWFLQEGRLLSDRSDAAIHVVRGGGRFHIPSPTEFDANGFNWNEVVEAQDGSMEHVAAFPGSGSTLRERSAPAVYVVYGGKAFHIPSPDVFEALGLDWSAVRAIPDQSAGGMRDVPREGTLLKELSSPAVYVMHGGELRGIPSAEEFERRGFSWDLIGVVPDGALAALPVGKNLEETHPGVVPVPASWAERAGGTVYTADGDEIDFTVRPNEVGADEVEFVLELGDGITWRKELVLRDGGGGEWTIAVQDDTRSDRNGLYREQLPGGALRFRKAKMFGIVTDVHGLGNLEQLPTGARVTFRWRKD
jgi:hypothetical protein